MTIIEALESHALLGALPAFADLTSWRAWLVFLKSTYGLPMDAEEQATFRHHTGRSVYAPPAGGWQEVACIVGRQSGKTRIAATLAAYEAIVGAAERDGTEVYCLLVSQDARAALRTVFSYACAPFDLVPLLRAMVPSGWRALWKKARRADSLTLDNGTRLAAYPCRPTAVRGLRARVVVCDEVAHYRTSENYPADKEMLTAVRPCVATTGGKLIVLSSPYAQSGALYELHRRHFGREDAAVLVWQASAPEMNPLLSADYLERMQADDPDAYASEVLGQFRAGLSTFFDAAALSACVSGGVRERKPVSGVAYVAHFDPSGGRNDAAALAIAHPDGERGVLDAIRAWPSPHNPASVIGEACALLRRYGLSEVVGDKYAAEFCAEQFRSHGVTYRASDKDRSALYLELLPNVNAGAVVLLDDAETLRELRGLERRRGANRDRIDHAPGSHDDRAVAVAGALVAATVGSTQCPFCSDPQCSGMHLLNNPEYLAHANEQARWRSANPDVSREARTIRELAGLLVIASRARQTDEALGRLEQIRGIVEGAPPAGRPRLEALVAELLPDLVEEDA